MPYTTSNISGNLRVSGGLFEVIGTGIIPNLYAGRDVVVPAAVETRGLAGQYFVNLRYANQDSLEYALRNQRISLYSGSTSSGPWLPLGTIGVGPWQHQVNITGFSAITTGTFFPGKIPGTTWFPKVLIEPLTVDQRIQKTSASGLFALSTNDRIGIGLTTPTDKLHVRGNTRIEGNLILNGTAIVTGELISGKVLRGGDNSTIRGSNTYGAAILAGANHTNTGTFGIIVGGFNNQVLADSAIVVGGFNHINSGKASFIGGGSSNQIIARSGDLSENSTIVGGSSNIARGDFVTVVGGFNNQAYSDSSTAVGGINNCLTGNFATIGGGGYNFISGGCYNTIGGGECNLIGGNQSVIAGGHCNCISGFFLAGGGGGFNCVAGWFGTIPGGYHNDVGGPQVGLEDNEWFAKFGYASVLGGANNKAKANSAVVLGGWCNCTESYAGLVGNGKNNEILGYVGYYNTILNGKDNAIHTDYPNPPSFNSGWLTGYDGEYSEHASILGGKDNFISNSDYSIILGGRTNIVGSGGRFTSILGGRRNTLYGKNELGILFGSGLSVNQDVKNFAAFGGNHFVTLSNTVSFNDYPDHSTQTLAPNLFHLNFKHGMGIAPYIQLGDLGSSEFKIKLATYGNALDLRTGIQTSYVEKVTNRIFQTIQDVAIEGKSLREYKDCYGSGITGILIDNNSQYNFFPINIGLSNKADAFALAPLYPPGTFFGGGMASEKVFGLDPYYGETPLTGLAYLVPNPSIVVGQLNRTSFGDIALGYDNKNNYEKNTSGPNHELSYLNSGIDFWKSKYNIFVGIANFSSGNGNIMLGSSNNINYGGEINMALGSCNLIIPMTDCRGYSYFVPNIENGQYVGNARNVNWSGSPTFYNAVIGQLNWVESKQNAVVLGAKNTVNAGRSTNLIGSSNTASGIRSNIIGNNIFNNGNCNTILGSHSWLNSASDSIIVGPRQLVNDFNEGFTSFRSVFMGTDNQLQARRSIVLGTENQIERVHNSIILGTNNYNGNFLCNNVLLGTTNWVSGVSNKVIGSHNYLYDSHSTIQIGDENISNFSKCSIVLGNDHYGMRDRTISLGVCTCAYNYGQISISTDNGYAGTQGSMQKIDLAWKGVTTAATQQQLYLDGVESATTWVSGLATIPSGRIWNGTMNIVAAQTGLAEFKTWQKAITVYNRGSTAGGITIAGQDDVKVYSSSANVNSWGVMLSGNNTNNALALFVTGATSRNIVWNIQGSFNDTRIPTRERLASAKIVSGYRVPVVVQ